MKKLINDKRKKLYKTNNQITQYGLDFSKLAKKLLFMHICSIQSYIKNNIVYIEINFKCEAWRTRINSSVRHRINTKQQFSYDSAARRTSFIFT